jgi:hypothetical protein
MKGLARIEGEIKANKNEARGFFCFLVSVIMLGVCYTGAEIISALYFLLTLL